MSGYMSQGTPILATSVVNGIAADGVESSRAVASEGRCVFAAAGRSPASKGLIPFTVPGDSRRSWRGYSKFGPDLVERAREAFSVFTEEEDVINSVSHLEQVWVQSGYCLRKILGPWPCPDGIPCSLSSKLSA